MNDSIKLNSLIVRIKLSEADLLANEKANLRLDKKLF